MSGDAGYNPNNLYRNSLARYFLPSTDEWYKAAYYDPVIDVHYDYPTGSNATPTPVPSGTTAGTAVYAQDLGSVPVDITLTGGLSPYGTMGQGGNVDELEETDFDLVNDSGSSPRGYRGGNVVSVLSNMPSVLSSSNRNSVFTSGGAAYVGFRVAAIPEPSTLLLGLLAGVGLMLRRR